jgi:arginine/lysine/ornithine decarboxylase
LSVKSRRNKDGAAKDTQDRAPILEALQTHLRANSTSFDVPGHQGGNAAPHSVTRLIGKDAFAADDISGLGVNGYEAED